jgi:hypothetical protein
LIHDCRLRGNQKIESLAVKQQMKIAEIFRTDIEGKISSQQQSSQLIWPCQDARPVCSDDSVLLAVGIIRMAIPTVKVRVVRLWRLGYDAAPSNSSSVQSIGVQSN